VESAPSYRSTASRPRWSALPAHVRSSIEAALGGPVVRADVAAGGFTRGFAAVLTVADGSRAFVKATSIDYLVDAYRRESSVVAALPTGVPAARLRWTASSHGWYVLCLDAISGSMPSLPWSAADLAAALDAWALTAHLLRSGLATLDLPSFGDIARETFTVWRDIHGHQAPLPEMPRFALAHLVELAQLERRLVALAFSSEIMHGDLRLDNVLVEPGPAGTGGRAWLCDWNHVCRGPAWFDTLSLLVTAYASGHDANALFAGHPTASAAPGDAPDAGLAALAGLWLSRAGRASDASASIRQHQRWSGEMALHWLGTRRGWIG